jgi:uncharacterized protein involved in exopolysaccharide biosynthesis
VSDTIRFVDFVLPLVRRRRMIVSIVLVAAIVSVVAALLWPKSWRATVTLLPPERRMDNPMFIPGSFEGLGASLRGITLRHVATPTDIFIAILDSRNVAEALVQRFGLQEEYDVESVQKAAQRLQKSTNIFVTQDGTIRIAAVASSAAGAAELANAYVEELDRVNLSLAGAQANAIREFIETELEEGRVRLATAEEALRDFQEEYGAIEITEQARAVIAAAAEIRAQILTAEVELGVLQRTRVASHPDVVYAQDYLAELRLRLAEIEGRDDPLAIVEIEKPLGGNHGTNGDSAAAALEPAPEADVFPPLSRIPSLGLKWGRLFRELKTEEAVVTLLTEQFHRARIEEKRSLPTVRVLDPAVAPERRYRPRRSIMSIVGTLGGFAIAVMLAYGLELSRRIRNDPARYAGLHEIGADLKKGMRT